MARLRKFDLFASLRLAVTAISFHAFLIACSSGGGNTAPEATIPGAPFLTSESGGGATPTPTPTPTPSPSATPTLTSLTLQADSLTLNPGSTTSSSALAFYSDGTTANVTAAATLSSSDTGVLSVAANGTVTAIASGSATLEAQYGGLTASRALTVSSATLSSLSLSPTLPTLALGSQRAFRATGHYSNGTTADLTSSVTWASSNSGVLSLSASGLGTAQTAGTSTISATSGALSASTLATVSSATLSDLQVSPVLASGGVGGALQLEATALYSDQTHSDVTNQVSWSSSHPAVASV